MFLTLMGVAGLRASTFTVSNVNDSGIGSLRSAISNANAIAGVDLVDFNLAGSGPFTINLAAVLPSITEPLTIDGTTQPGYSGKPLINVDGNAAAGNGTGIYLLSSNCVVAGLSLSRFAREGIRIEGDGGNIIRGNHIGPGPYGTNLFGNGNGASGFGGITILSSHNQIGGTDAADRNIISGSNYHGIFLLSATAKENVIEGNYIGVDVTGTKRLGNANNGIALATGANGNVVGGTNNGTRNVISGNTQSGVYLLDAATVRNVVAGNFIGTDVNGTSAISNAAEGVTISGSVSNVIGGSTAEARNVISGNKNRGVVIAGVTAHDNLIQGNFIGTDVTGTAKLANTGNGVEILNAPSNTVGGSISGAGNVISGNSLSGVYLNGATATGNMVQGNLIGTSVSGTNALGNGSHGVLLANGAANNLVGGSTTAVRNVISGNLQNGVYLADAATAGNQVAGNYIGTSATGAARLGNAFSGVRLEAPLNVIGGTSAAERNIISGNTNGHGVYLTGSLATSNTVAGNFIGTDAAGTTAVRNGNANDFSGIYILNAVANQIGGPTDGMRNVISGNADKGVIVFGASATRNLIQGNRVGTTASGNSALGNPNGGVFFYGCASNSIGGAVSGAGNLISASGADAIRFGDLNPGGAGARFNFIQGNKIGTTADGAGSLGNLLHGINLDNGSSNNIVGGINPGEGNVIANALSSGYDGVRLRDGTRNNLVRGNSIYGNGNSSAAGLGIDLSGDGVNANDACDSDGVAFANLLQNYPTLSNAVSGAGFTWVRGVLNSTASTTFLLQFYANATAESSGYGEGQLFLGDATVTTGTGCTTEFAVRLANATPAGYRISATATDPAGNTSEFGPTVVVIPQPTLSLAVAIPGTSAVFQWTNTAMGFVLQQATNLNSPVVWTAVTNVPVEISGQFRVTLTPATGNRFYRLMLP